MVCLAFWMPLIWACSLPPFERLEDFLKKSKPTQAVFEGRVLSVLELPQTAGRPQESDIVFEVQRRWRGAAQPTVTVRGLKDTVSGTSCQGLFDFSAQVGETWLIVGRQAGSVVDPSVQLSKKVVNGALSPRDEKILNGKRRRP
jgi:hypothetical protein